MTESLLTLGVVAWGVARKGVLEDLLADLRTHAARANNFMAWCRGPKVDYDDWAELVGDQWWRWESVLTVLNEVRRDESVID